MVKKPASGAQMQFAHATPSPRARQIAGSVICGSYVEIAAEISIRDNSVTEQSFLILVFGDLCATTVTSLVERLDCSTPYWRANHGHDKEITDYFVLLSVVYHDGTFKAVPSDFSTPTREVKPKILCKSYQTRYEYMCASLQQCMYQAL